MSNRVYLLIAAAFLIGAPLVVNVVSSALPGAQQTAQAAATQPDAPEAPDPEAPEAPQPIAQAPQLEPASAEPLFDAAPSMDTQGIDPGTAGQSVEAPVPAHSPTQALRAAVADDPVAPRPAPPPPPPPPPPDIAASALR
jgi:hypothetical protein